MLDQRSIPPAYPDEEQNQVEGSDVVDGSKARIGIGCVAYYHTDMLKPTVDYNPFDDDTKEGQYTADEGGKLRVRQATLEEGVVKMLRSDECKEMNFAGKMKAAFNEGILDKADNEIHVLTLDTISAVQDLESKNAATQGPAIAKLAQAQVDTAPECEEDKCKELKAKWAWQLSGGWKQGLHRDDYQYCVFMLNENDAGWGQHILCSQTKDEMEGWRHALGLHRYAYQGEGREEENEFAALMDEEFEKVELTVDEVSSRHQKQIKAGIPDTETNSKEQEGIVKMYKDSEKAIKKQGDASLLQFSGENASHTAALASAQAAVNSAVAKFSQGYDLLERDAEDVHKAVDIFAQVFLEAHSHVQFLHEHGATMQWMCKASSGSRGGFFAPIEVYEPGECVKSSEYRAHEFEGNWVRCSGVYNCNFELRQNSYGFSGTCGMFQPPCATQINGVARVHMERATQRQFQQNMARGGCFPSDALLEVESSETMPLPALRPIAEVRVGDVVRTNAGFERVFAVTAFMPGALADYLRIAFNNGEAVLELTANHLLPVGLQGLAKRADAIRAGDLVRLADGSLKAVLSVVRVSSKGLHNLKTASGSLAVRAPGSKIGIIASTSADVGLPSWFPTRLLELPLLPISHVVPSMVDAGGALPVLVDLYENTPSMTEICPVLTSLLK